MREEGEVRERVSESVGEGHKEEEKKGERADDNDEEDPIISHGVVTINRRMSMQDYFASKIQSSNVPPSTRSGHGHHASLPGSGCGQMRRRKSPSDHHHQQQSQ